MAKKHQTDLQCKETIYLTPPRVLDPVKEYFGGQIPLDPSTQPENPTEASVFCVEPPGDHPLVQLAQAAGNGPICLVDGLKTKWSDYDGTFTNPPYGKIIKEWCQKIHEEAVMGAEIIALLPCGPRFATKYFQAHILTECLDVTCFVSPRVKFLRPDGSGTGGSNPYDSMLMGWNVEIDKFAQCFRRLGRVMKMEIL